MPSNALTGDGLGRAPAEHPEGGAAGGKSPAGPAQKRTIWTITKYH